VVQQPAGGAWRGEVRESGGGIWDNPGSGDA
jgi:hypothetical protein